MCCDHYSIKIAKVCYRTRKGSKQNITGKTSTNLQLKALVQASQLPTVYLRIAFKCNLRVNIQQFDCVNLTYHR